MIKTPLRIIQEAIRPHYDVEVEVDGFFETIKDIHIIKVNKWFNRRVATIKLSNDVRCHQIRSSNEEFLLWAESLNIKDVQTVLTHE